MTISFDRGSFRDRESRVVIQDGDVVRLLTQEAVAHWAAFSSSPVFKKLLEENKIVESSETSLPTGLDPCWVKALKHPCIPFISYPYEWCFEMLKDAAMLTLEIIERSMADGFILKDSSAFNVQYIGARPIFIDIGSFSSLRKNELWVGYKQFCEMFFYPLFLCAHKNIEFQSLFRGYLDGISPSLFVRMLSIRDLFRPGAFTHGYLQAKIQSSMANSNSPLKSELSEAGFNKEMIRSNVLGLKKLVSKLHWSADSSEWSDYQNDRNYTEADLRQKTLFVESAVGFIKPALLWDLGCNTGEYSKIAIRHSKYVIALDSDHLSVNRFYKELKASNTPNILPLVMNLTNPSASQGWRSVERTTLDKRGKPDMVLCLALIHHLCISNNIPLADILDWLSELTDNLVIEFISKTDAMVKRLLANKDDIYFDYTKENFENLVNENFSIVKSETFSAGKRTIYFARKKGA